ncbi:lactonase family protein [Candidatus Babeliales bacterium]|nr:lactonase family protein [Candidatus Babeliales bacterium]
MRRLPTFYLFCAAFITTLLYTPTNLFSALKFVSRNSNLVLNPQPDARVGLRKVSQITGFSQDSIISVYGNNTPSSWTETYTAGVEIGTGRRGQPSNMVYNNSNAIKNMQVLALNNSNATASLARRVINDSSALIKLQALARADSQLLVFLNRLENANSNALNFGIKNNSSAIIRLYALVRGNSNVIVSASRLAKQNSSAIVRFNNNLTTNLALIRQNSSAVVKLSADIANTLSPLNVQTSNAINFFGNNVQIVSNHSRFQATTTINKLILYKAGISVNAGKTLTLMTPLPLSGNIALNSTGKLNLAGDLYLNSNAYITSGGDLGGNNFSLVLSDSLVLSTLTSLKITSSLVIDGNGGTIIFGPHAQIVLESNVSLTLKNVNIQTTRNSSNIPIIRCFDQKGHVTFDNVNLSLADDFPFRTGRLFCFNDARVTGTSRFVYQSWMQSYVMPQSLLTFDPGSALYYYPSTTDKDLFQLTDKSSGIYLKGSATTLQTTHTGMRLTKGRLWMDNKITLSTGTNTRFSSLTQTSSINISGSSFVLCDWSPDGRFLATINSNNENLRVFQVSTTGLTLVASYVVTSPGSSPCSSVHWHPSGRFIALTERRTVAPTNRATVLSFNGSSLSVLSQVTYSTSLVHTVAWSPCGCYLAAYGADASNTIQVYRFNGKALSTSAVATAAFSQGSPGVGKHIRWSPDGRYLGVYFNTTTFTITQASVYRFNETSLTLQSSSTLSFTSSFPITDDLDWRADGLFFAVGTNNTNNTSDPILAVYSFNGSTQSLATSSLNSSASVTIYYTLDWSPDGRYIAVGGTENGLINNIRIFEFNGASVTSRYTLTIGGTNVVSLRWTPDGKYLAAGLSSNPGQVIVYQVNYTSESNAQALTNGINFGNSTLGSTSDLDVFLLAGARVELNGLLFYNNVS